MGRMSNARGGLICTGRWNSHAKWAFPSSTEENSYEWHHLSGRPRRRGQGVRPVLPRSSVGARPHGHRHHRWGFPQRSPVETAPLRYLDWGPVILGALGAAAMSIVLLAFGSALGLSVVACPMPMPASRQGGAGHLAAVYLAIVMVAELCGRRLHRRAHAHAVAHDRRSRDAFPRRRARLRRLVGSSVLLGAALAASGVGAVLSPPRASATTAIAAAGTAGAASNPAMGQLSLRPTGLRDRSPARPGANRCPGGGGCADHGRDARRRTGRRADTAFARRTSRRRLPASLPRVLRTRSSTPAIAPIWRASWLTRRACRRPTPKNASTRPMPT